MCGFQLCIIHDCSNWKYNDYLLQMPVSSLLYERLYSCHSLVSVMIINEKCGVSISLASSKQNYGRAVLTFSTLMSYWNKLFFYLKKKRHYLHSYNCLLLVNVQFLFCQNMTSLLKIAKFCFFQWFYKASKHIQLRAVSVLNRGILYMARKGLTVHASHKCLNTAATVKLGSVTYSCL